MRVTASFVAGLIFGLGLVISGMSNPAKVLNFLDIAGTFDPSLIFVMAGAVTIAFLGYKLSRYRSHPLLDDKFHGPAAASVDKPLVAGAAIFGLGWGLAGFCPGPAVTALASLSPKAFVFAGFMVVGIWLALVSRAAASAEVAVEES